jgi:hypothetical protein
MLAVMDVEGAVESLRPIQPAPRGGFGGGEVPNWKNVKMSIRILHFNQFGGQIGQSENFFLFLANRLK